MREGFDGIRWKRYGVIILPRAIKSMVKLGFAKTVQEPLDGIKSALYNVWGRTKKFGTALETYAPE